MCRTGSTGCALLGACNGAFALLRAPKLCVTGQVADGVTLHASTMVHPCWAVLPMGFTGSLYSAQSLGEELTAAEAAERTPLLRDCATATSTLSDHIAFGDSGSGAATLGGSIRES